MSHPPRLKSADAATSAWRPRRHGPDLVGPPLCWCWGGHFLTLYHHTQRLWWMIALIGAVLSASMIYGQHVLLVWWWKKNSLCILQVVYLLSLSFISTIHCKNFPRFWGYLQMDISSRVLWYIYILCRLLFIIGEVQCWRITAYDIGIFSNQIDKEL